jgi:hypothetical protein
MKNEQKTKKGFFSILRESFSKTGGCCCGPGETCGGSTPEAEKPQPKTSKETTKPAQK